MSAIRVIIATTTGPVTVQRITEEDPDVNSVVCLAGKAMALPISPAYDAFVRDPTGIVQRHFDHPAFRVDVSEKIDEGYSWQLGLFVAHALHDADRLAKPDETCQRAVIATGEVDRDLNVLTVNGNAEKTKTLRSEVIGLVDQNIKVTIAVPRENAPHWQDELTDLVDKFPNAIDLLAVATVEQLLGHLDVALPRRRVVMDAPVPIAPRRQKGLWLAGVIILFIGASSVAGGVSFRPQLATLSDTLSTAFRTLISRAQPESSQASAPKPNPKPEPLTLTPKVVSTTTPKETISEIPKEPLKSTTAIATRLHEARPPIKPVAAPKPAKTPEKDVLVASRKPSRTGKPLRIQINEVRAPEGYRCDQAQPKEMKSTVRSDQRRGTIQLSGPGLDRLCSIDIRADPSGDRTYLFGRYLRWTQGRVNDAPPDKIIDLGPRDGPVSWSIDVPQRLRHPAAFQVIILASSKKFQVPEKLLRQLDRVKSRGDAFRTLRNRLQEINVTLIAKQFRVVPERDSRRPPPRRPYSPNR